MPGGTPQPGPSAPLSSAPSYPAPSHPPGGCAQGPWLHVEPRIVTALAHSEHHTGEWDVNAGQRYAGRPASASTSTGSPRNHRLFCPCRSRRTLVRCLLTGRDLAGFKYAHVDELHSFLRDALVQFGEAPTHPTAGDCQPGDCLPGAPNRYLVPVTSRTDLSLDPRECKRLTSSSVVVCSGDAPKVAVAEVQGGFPVWDLQTSGLERSGSSSGASG